MLVSTLPLTRRYRPRDFTFLDLAAYLVILALGAMQIFWYLRASDVVYDATYVDLARSLLQGGGYRFDFRPETLLPPGFPALLALVWLVSGPSHAVGLHVTAVCATLALVANYELLRRVEGRTVAFLAAVLLGSSPSLFLFTTGTIGPDTPYFLVTTVTLLLILKIDNAGSKRASVGLILLCSASLATAILLRTAGLVMVLGLAGWIITTFWFDSNAGWARLRAFGLPVLLGICAQLAWFSWSARRESPEWSVPGYPHPYLAQLKVKNGNEPMLGMATLRDVPPRVAQNIARNSSEFVKLMTHKSELDPYWCSPFVAGVVMLVGLGFAWSLKTYHGQPWDWYFGFYVIMLLPWPWDYEMRLLMQVAPLALLYAWRGANVLLEAIGTGSLLCGLCLAAAGAIFSFGSIVWINRAHTAQAVLSLALWAVSFVLGAAIIFLCPGMTAAGIPASKTPLALAGRWNRESIMLALQVAGFLVCSVFVTKGVVADVRIGRWNRKFDLHNWILNPDIDAGEWVRRHVPSDAVVMARKKDLIYHYSDRRVIWFPPTNDPRLLMEGIQKYHVSIIVVVDKDDGYWRPSQTKCFEPLRRSYPDAFQPIYRGRGYWVYGVESRARAPVAQIKSGRP